MIKTIVFDLNRVLVTYKDMNERYVKTFGITQKKFWRSAKEFFGDYVVGKKNLNEFLLSVLDKNKLNRNKLLEAKRLHEENLSPIPKMNNLLESLKPNYSLILAAGEGKESLELKLRTLNLIRYFEKVYATCYMGLVKTDINFYKEIMYKENLKSDETLFIDDQKSHLNVAKKLGIHILLFENLPKLKYNLKTKFNLVF